MRLVACALCLLLLPSPALAQADAPTRSQIAESPDVKETPEVKETVVVPEKLQRIFDLVKQPGPHPELVGLIGIELAQEATVEDPSEGGLKGWQKGLIIGVAAVAVVMLLVVLAVNANG